MGKYRKYFCMEIPACMISMGVCMGIFSLSLFVGDFAFSIVLIIESKEMNPYFFAFALFAMFTFCLAGIFQSILCCKSDYGRNINKFFNLVIVFSLIAAVFAVIDGVWKFYLGGIINSIVLFVYALVTIFVILIAYMAKRELFMDRLDELQKFNNLQGPAFTTSGLDGIPRYPMALRCEEVQVDQGDEILDDNNDVYEAPLI